MFKTLVFITLLALPCLGFRQEQPALGCNCPEVTNLTKTGSTSASLSYSWTGSSEATQYMVWYHHEDSDYTSPGYLTGNTSYTFSNLSLGCYTLYFAAVCGGEQSGYIGIQDIVNI